MSKAFSRRSAAYEPIAIDSGIEITAASTTSTAEFTSRSPSSSADRLLRGQRGPEVAVQQAAEPAQVLARDRTGRGCSWLLQRRQPVRGRVAAQDGAGRVAAAPGWPDEDEDRDEEQDEDAEQQPPDDEAGDPAAP